ncbi:hypothetical protein ACFCZT_24750 [Streptomyces sp. NPDC056230]|uniref:hypothetical protein n=1 Tax=Streptomyces sp. NPDC056230 TaxID=3345754 RepID=UPI0035DEB4EE
MIIVVGPMDSPHAIAALHAAADEADALPADEADVCTATEVYLLPSWRRCPKAVADVTMAEELCLPIHDLIPAATLAIAS